MPSAARYLGVALAALLLAGSARAETIGFTAYFTGASVAIDNLSDFSELTAFSLTIGDTAYNFDRATSSFTIGGPGRSFVQISPGDDADGGLRSDLLAFTFDNFMPGDRFDSLTDIDPDSGDSGCCNASGVLFNNGDALNAQMSATFSNGFTLDTFMTDTQAAPDPGGDQCLVFGMCTFTLAFDVPEPALLLLVGVAAAALAAARRFARS